MLNAGLSVSRGVLANPGIAIDVGKRLGETASVHGLNPPKQCCCIYGEGFASFSKPFIGMHKQISWYGKELGSSTCLEADATKIGKSLA